MGMSRSEVNMRRLIAKCELLIKSKKSQENDSRLENYVDVIEETLLELEKSPDKPTNELMFEYSQRLDKIKSNLDKFKKSTTFVESYDDSHRLDELLQESKPQRFKSQRQELLGLSDDLTPETGFLTHTEDVDSLLKQHNTMQERITNEMLSLTQSLKEQTQLAGAIIRKDTETIKKSINVSEGNFEKLKVESEKLSQHSKSACKCWLWAMVAIVLIVFMNMVLFMKVAKKT